MFLCRSVDAQCYVGALKRELLLEHTEVAEAELEESGDRIRVELVDTEANASVLAKIIVNGGLQLIALEPVEMNLEDVFLQVTRGETQ